jgi:cell division protein FtsB
VLRAGQEVTPSAAVGWFLLAFFLGSISTLWFVPAIYGQVLKMARATAKKWKEIASTCQQTAALAQESVKLATDQVNELIRQRDEFSRQCDESLDQTDRILVQAEKLHKLLEEDEARIAFAKSHYPDLIGKWRALTAEERAKWIETAKAERETETT